MTRHLVLALALAACGGGSTPTEPIQPIDSNQKLGAVIHTALGDIRCSLLPDAAPKTVANFVGLAEGGREWKHPTTGQKMTKPLYSGTVFHRVIKGFMIQGGDPLGNGRGGPGYRFEDEIDPKLVFDREGILAMANAGPNTNGSQFFITDGAATHLNGRHTIFGTCEMEIVKRIADQPMQPSLHPMQPPQQPEVPVVIERIEIIRG